MKNIFKEVLSYIVTIVVAIGIVFTFRHFIAEPFAVDGRSMDYTLADGQRLFMFKLSKVDRFDVVVLPSPTGDTDAKGNIKLYIKRVIGVPGDTIEYKDDQLHLNGHAVEEPYLAQKQSETNRNFTEDFTLEAITGQTVVPEGKVFVMGDNRQNSLDSRSFGFVNIDDIKGEADFIYWPLNQIGFLDKYKIDEAGNLVPR
ncbi:signal peptidase I [Aerococcaceae bacterium NML191292]|nr:signal peptidase I [Aerococcaceae bacterium NML191292]MCW6662601.1 signal peptidase I [Aerococcaceae bacterium NML190073]MCW6665831.1 signal peptidase I [Aerococcaceae bacterium NML191219]MCW6674346.1 signal peptidase I [Aerococcaceae bacterium NML171108]MCW6676217.1 signal peptidase I [Aerococcaceae bacterium NML180378]